LEEKNFGAAGFTLTAAGFSALGGSQKSFQKKAGRWIHPTATKSKPFFNGV
jgi:hypothetical protein